MKDGFLRREEQILQSLDGLKDELDCFDFLLDSAAEPGFAFDETLRQERYLVKGCDSLMWVHSFLSEDGRIRIRADSDSMLLRGVLMLLCRLYNGLPAGEVPAEGTRLMAHPLLKSCFSGRQKETLKKICSDLYDLAAAYRKGESYEKSN